MERLFPLRSWEMFRVVVPERHNSVGGDLIKGLVHGKPGEGRADVIERARDRGLLGLFEPGHIRLEWVDR